MRKIVAADDGMGLSDLRGEIDTIQGMTKKLEMKTDLLGIVSCYKARTSEIPHSEETDNWVLPFILNRAIEHERASN